jgi:hypothetical protein
VEPPPDDEPPDDEPPLDDEPPDDDPPDDEPLELGVDEPLDDASDLLAPLSLLADEVPESFELDESLDFDSGFADA